MLASKRAHVQFYAYRRYLFYCYNQASSLAVQFQLQDKLNKYAGIGDMNSTIFVLLLGDHGECYAEPLDLWHLYFIHRFSPSFKWLERHR